MKHQKTVALFGFYKPTNNTNKLLKLTANYFNAYSLTIINYMVSSLT